MNGRNAGRDRLKAIAGPRWTAWGRSVLKGLPLPRWGNLRRVTPFSTTYGSDRGTPVDRYYLHRFLEVHRAEITGRVLEIQMPSYTERYGHDVVESHSVDINRALQPTYACDLALGDIIASDRYDCFLAPNTLQHLADLDPALRTMLRVVKPGGVILASAAGFLPLVTDYGDYWHLSADGWRRVLGRQWAGCHVEVEAHGNCLTALAAMHGLALEELTAAELAAHDPRYPVLVTIRCRKPSLS